MLAVAHPQCRSPNGKVNVQRVRIFLAHNSGPRFSKYSEAPAYLDALMNEAGIEVSDRFILDNFQSSGESLIGRRGWKYVHLPEASNEFESWSTALRTTADGARSVLFTSAVLRRGVPGGPKAVARALRGSDGAGPIGRLMVPQQIRERWVRNYFGSYFLVLPRDWSEDDELCTFQMSDLDPTFDPKNPFGVHASVPQGLTSLALWWCTSRFSGYPNRVEATATNMDFIYRKAIAIANEASVALRFIERSNANLQPPKRSLIPEAGMVTTASAEDILASRRDIFLASALADPEFVARCYRGVHAARVIVSRTRGKATFRGIRRA